MFLGLEFITEYHHYVFALQKEDTKTKILFCGGGLKRFPPLNGTNSETIPYRLLYILAQYPKKEKLPVDFLRLNTLIDTKIWFLIPKGDGKHPVVFYIGVTSDESRPQTYNPAGCTL